MTETHFTALYTNFQAMEKEYTSAFKATVTGVLTFLPWLDADMVSMYVDVGRLTQALSMALVNY